MLPPHTHQRSVFIGLLMLYKIIKPTIDKSIVHADMDELTPEKVRFLSGEENEFEYALCDMDQDGMDDAWEKKVGLDPANPEDRNRTTEVGYTALEVYLNSLVGESISYNFKK